MKTNKSYSKRLKVTKNGKIMARPKGQNHFNAKESGNTTRAKRGTDANFKMTPKQASRLLPKK